MQRTLPHVIGAGLLENDILAHHIYDIDAVSQLVLKIA
jgi:hypothetical protein